MESLDTFQLQPITMDPATKVLSAPSSKDSQLQSELTSINALQRATLSLETPNQIIPPPQQFSQKRSQQIAKLRDSGNTNMNSRSFEDAIRMYSLAIDMALQRPAWEPAGLVREEVAVLYANRAQAYMSMRQWADALIDSECSVEAKRGPGNPKAWWRLGKCLVEMGRYDEAREKVNSGLEVEANTPGEGELLTLKKEIDRKLDDSAV